MGAVAQVGRRPRPQNPLTAGLPSFIQHLPRVPLAQAQPSKHEQQALNHIWSDDVVGLKKMPKQVKQLIMNPTPLMQAHINSHPSMPQNHQDLQFAVANNNYNMNSPAWKQRVNKAAFTPQFRQQLKQIGREAKKQQQMPSGVQEMGLGGLMTFGPVANYLQKSVATPIAKLGTGLGPGVADLAVHGYKEGAHLGYSTARAMGLHPGGGDPGSQGAYFKGLGGEMLHSYRQTFTHPLWDLKNPVEAGLNILPFVTAGAGAALKAGDIAEIAGRVDLSASEKAAQIASRLKAPHGYERRISVGIPDRHFDTAGFDSHGFHKEDYVPPAHLGGNHFPRMPIYANPKNPAESIFGPPGLGHADIMPVHGPHGHVQASAIIGDDGQVAKVNLHGKGGGLTPEQEKNLAEALRQHANDKLDEAGRETLHTITPPTAKSSIGALMQMGIDKMTERAMAGDLHGTPNIRAFGRYYKLPRPVMNRLQARWGKLGRLDLEMNTQIQRGVAEQQILKELHDLHGAPRPLTQAQAERMGISPAEAQKEAYGKGAAQVHAEEWHNLWNGGMGANDHILHNLDDYVAIKKPQSREDIIKNFKAYSNNKAIADQWHGMVQGGKNWQDAVRENPDDYSFMPKKAFNAMRPVPSEKMAGVGSFLQPMDNVTQIIRSGRFMTPAYLQWAVQNGVLHLSQAGAFAFRNFNRARHELPKLSPEDRAFFENSAGSGHYGGGITRASMGSEETKLGSAGLEKLKPVAKYKDFAAKAARMWHAVDDAPFRNASLVHELARYGYHNAEDWSKLIKNNPQRFRMIARQAQREAIDYSEMSPAERATFQKMFTAWGWTRGATSWAGRFPFQHPFQATVGAQVARHGEKQVEAPYEKAGGMVPEWLATSLPIGKGGRGLLDTNVISPFSTPGELMQAMGGLTHGQTQNLGALEAPTPSSITEWALGRDKYGNALRGNERIRTPIQDLINRFKPISVYHALVGSKHGGGTFEQSRLGALEQFMGVPYEKLTNLPKTAALGMKDYEQSLSMPDEINFRHDYTMKQLPRELKIYAKKNGSPLSASDKAMLVHDIAAVHDRDIYQYQYAQKYGARSFKSLPASDRAKAGIQFMVEHKFFTPEIAREARQYMSQAKNEKEMDTAASKIWDYGGRTGPIGHVSTRWKDMLKKMQPPPLEAGRK